jgi:hypothetical protein
MRRGLLLSVRAYYVIMGRDKPHMAGGRKASAKNNKKSKLVLTFDPEKRKYVAKMPDL